MSGVMEPNGDENGEPAAPDETNGEEEVANVVDAPEAAGEVVYDSEAVAAAADALDNGEPPASDELGNLSEPEENGSESIASDDEGEAAE